MKTLAVTLIALCTLSLTAQPVAKAIQSTLTAAAKVSGKTLSPALRKTMFKSLSVAVAKHGEAALKATRLGGLEVLKQGSKYGDDFWRVVCKAEPQAVRSLALHAEQLLPIAKRVGPKFLELEARTPGLGKHVVACFGDKGAGTGTRPGQRHLPAGGGSEKSRHARDPEAPFRQILRIGRQGTVPQQTQLESDPRKRTVLRGGHRGLQDLQRRGKKPGSGGGKMPRGSLQDRRRPDRPLRPGPVRPLSARDPAPVQAPVEVEPQPSVKRTPEEGPRSGGETERQRTGD